MSAKQRSFWGWGYEEDAIDETRRKNLRAMIQMQLGKVELRDSAPPSLDEVELPAPRAEIPSRLADIVTTETRERAAHSYGKSFRDVVRALSRQYPNPPDAIALPRSEEELVAVLDWCDSSGHAAIPYGGGSSVTGGVEPPPRGDRAVITIDLRNLGQVLEVDPVSRAARIQAGAYGPALEEQLAAHDFTLRHFPQSFEFSTLGGWIATRAGGHFATNQTHIEDFLESVRVVTPRGTLETRRLPGSGAGPSPDRLFAGSEGALGIITEAWMRVQRPPTFRASCSVKFDHFNEAVNAVRELGQSGLYPANCRLLNPEEALVSGVGFDKKSVLLVAFESADHPPQEAMRRALDICTVHGGKYPEGSDKVREGGTGERGGAAGAWRRTFLEGPYLRDALTRMGLIIETFETAITWDKFDEFHEGVQDAVRAAIHEVSGAGIVSCRFTHVYPDGVAPYYTVLAAGKESGRLQQWDEIKAAASEAIIRLGGTITHHHAVGRDHRPWYDRQRPDLFAAALRGAKRELDPKGTLSPGILIDM